jgi:hypothetical protein
LLQASVLRPVFSFPDHGEPVPAAAVLRLRTAELLRAEEQLAVAVLHSRMAEVLL